MPFSTDALLNSMATGGQSVELYWGEDTLVWECSWISGGQRWTGFGHTPREAAQAALDAAPGMGKLPTQPPYNYQHDPACPQYQNAGSGMPCTCGQLFGL